MLYAQQVERPTSLTAILIWKSRKYFSKSCRLEVFPFNLDSKFDLQPLAAALNLK